jgi:PAS domain S-box-containing protein
MAIDLGLVEQLTLLAEAVDQLDMGFTVFDRDLVMVAANKRFQELLHFPDSLCRPGATMEDALRYNACAGEYGPGDIEEQVRQRLELSRKFLPHRFERVRPDGSIIEVSGQPLPSGGMVATYIDVTIPRQREQALRELSAQLELRVEERTAELRHREAELARKAALLELVISNVNQGISFINADLDIELCNQKFAELLQLPPELCRPGVNFAQLVHYNARRGEYGPGDPKALAQARIETAKECLPHHFERTRPSDGVTLEIMGKPTPDGGMVSTYLDISERKASERALKLERKRLSNILKGTNAGAWEVNLQTHEGAVNERWANIIGYTREELTPVSLDTMIAALHPDDIAPGRDALLQHLKGLTPYYRFEHRIRHKDGRWIWVAAHGQISTYTADGRAQWMAGAHLDITERKAAEHQIQELNETLEERVAERSAQLNEAMQTLHHSQEELARNAAKATLGTLVASVTHELNTPLGNSLITASTCSDMAKRFQARVDSGQLKRSDLNSFLAEIREGSDLIERNLHRAVDLVRNFKQVAADQASEQRRHFELLGVVKEVLDTLAPSLRRFPHQVSHTIPAAVMLDSFPGALGQVLINVINNAYLHAFEDREVGHVHIEAQVGGGWVDMYITDDGVGMSQELMAQLFQPFFSTKIGRGGTGLGMTIVENLVKKTLGGTLHVASTLGVGTRLHIRLPQSAPADLDTGLGEGI